MAVWKKVIVSGSQAHLAAVTASVYLAGTNQQITTSPSTTFLSGSFSGSFSGNGSGITNVTLSNNLTQGTGITSFTYNGSAGATVAVSGASSLNTNKITKWTGTAFADSSLTDNGTTISGTTSIQLTGASSNLSGSFSGSFSGNGSGLTGVTATFPSTQLTPLTTTAQVFINDGANKYATVAQFNSASWNGVSGDIKIDGTTGVATIQPDSVALGTDTSGNYVASVANGTGITAIAAASEGAAVTVSVSGASSLNSNTVTKWTGTAFANSLITDDGSTVTVGGNLQVNGTTATVNTTNLTVTDQFILLGSGSAANKDGGIIVQSAAAAGSGFAFAYDDTTDRWYMQDALSGTATALGTVTDTTTTMAVVAAQKGTAASRPADGTGTIYGGTSGYGNMWIDSDSSNDIWIYV